MPIKNPLQPLTHNVPIVDARTGMPSPEFMRKWDQQRLANSQIPSSGDYDAKGAAAAAQAASEAFATAADATVLSSAKAYSDAKAPPSGGTTGQVLEKNSNTNYDMKWATPSAGVSGANPTATAGPAAVNGSASTFMRSDAAPAVQKASASQFGIVEVDGTTITATGGVISATGGGGVTVAAQQYISAGFSQTSNTGAFATKGIIFTPEETISISEIDAYVNGVSAQVYVLSIAQVTVSGTSFSIASSLASTSSITLGATAQQRISRSIGPVTLTAGTTYALLVTMTSAAGGTTSVPVMQSSATTGRDAYVTIPKNILNLSGSFYDAMITAEIASNTVPSSGSITTTDSFQPCIGITYTNLTGSSGALAPGDLTVASSDIIVGNAGGVGAAVATSGDLTNDNTGKFTLNGSQGLTATQWTVGAVSGSGATFEEMLQGEGTTGVSIVLQQSSSSSAATAAPVLTQQRSGGTLAAPTAVATGALLFANTAKGYGATGFQRAASFRAYVIEPTPSDTAMGGQFQWWLSPLGSVTPANYMSLDPQSGLAMSTNIAYNKQRVTAFGSGTSLTISNNVDVVVFTPNATHATGTIIMPAAPVDGQIVRLAFGSLVITALTMSPNAGQTLDGGLTSTAANGFAAWVWDATAATWYRIG